MGLRKIAEGLDATLRAADQHVEAAQSRIVESDERKMAHHIMAFVLEASAAGTPPYELGASMVQGAYIGEDESGGALAEPVVAFLESLLNGAKSALTERVGGANPDLCPIQGAAQYFIAHNKWPEGVSSSVIAKAKAALGSSKTSTGTFI